MIDLTTEKLRRERLLRAFLLPFFVVFALSACASKTSPTTADYAGRIEAAFTELGAPDDRARCFAERLTAAGDIEAAREAAEIAEQATSRETMKERVMSATKPTRRAFIGANMRCMLS